MRQRNLHQFALVSLLAVGIVFIAACDLFDDDDDPVTIGFATLQGISALRVNDPGTAVFRTGAEWTEFWELNRSGTIPLPPVPVIDFDASMLVALFWGFGTGCGEPIEAVRGVVADAGALVVDVGPLPPTVCPAVAWPAQIIEIPRSTLPVIFTGDVPGDEI